MNELKDILLRVEAKLDMLLAALAEDDMPDGEALTALTGEIVGFDRDDTQPL